MPSKKRKYNARFPAGRIKKIMRIDEEIGKVALPVPVMISRALELFAADLLKKAGSITMEKKARTLTVTHLKQCIHSDSRLDFLKDLFKEIPDVTDEGNDINSTDSTVAKKRKITNNDDSDEEVLSTSRCDNDYNNDGASVAEVQSEIKSPLLLDDDASASVAQNVIATMIQNVTESAVLLDDDASAVVVQNVMKSPLLIDDDENAVDEQNVMDSPLLPNNVASTSVVQNVMEPSLRDSESNAKSNSPYSETNDNDDTDLDDNERTVRRQQFFEMLDNYHLQRIVTDVQNVPPSQNDDQDDDDSEDDDNEDDDLPTIRHHIGMFADHDPRMVVQNAQSPMIRFNNVRMSELDESFLNSGARPQFRNIHNLDDSYPPVILPHWTIDERVMNRLAICKEMESPWLIDGGKGAVEMQNIIEMHLLSDCNCSEQSPPHISRAFELFSAHLPPTRLSSGATLEYLSIARQLLLKFRSQSRNTVIGRCPALNIASQFLMSEHEWKERFFALLSSKNIYVEYEAVCASTELILSLAFDSRYCAVDHCYDVLFEIIKENQVPLRTGPAMDILRHVLEATNNQVNNVKRGLLVKMRRHWKSIVMQRYGIRYNSVSRLLDLYLAVLRVLQSLEYHGVNNLRNNYIYYLVKVKPLLVYGNPDRPHIYLKAVRLLGYALSVDMVTMPSKCRKTQVLTKHILDVFKDGSMLFSLRSVSHDSMWPENHTIALQETVMLALRTFRVFVNTKNSFRRADMVTNIVQILNAHVKLLGMYGEDVPFYRWLVRLMFERDDAIAECLRCILDLAEVNGRFYNLFQPFINFTELLACTSYNEGLFIDYLISTETQFLVYLMKIMRKIYIHSSRFFRKCGDELPMVISFFSRFQDKLAVKHFPYNIEPLRNIIRLCEDLHSEWEANKSHPNNS